MSITDAPFNLTNPRKTLVHRVRRRPTLSLVEIEDLLTGLDKEYTEAYADVPEAQRPRFSEWLTTTKDTFLTKQILRIGFSSGQAGTALKAMGLVLEFNKAKPKQQMELSTPVQPMMALSPEDLMNLACEVNGLDAEAVKARLSEPDVPTEKKQLN